MEKKGGVSGQFQKEEALIQGFLQEEHGMVDGFLDHALVTALRGNLFKKKEKGAMHAAGIGNHSAITKNEKIRGDTICWVDKKSKNKHEKEFNGRIEDFVGYLNRTCYTGINDFEFHYAYYEVGSFYKRHKDQFKTDNGRQFSLVTYLNEAWEEEDGGQLMLYHDQREVGISPIGGRTVFFKSDKIEHEVTAAKKGRVSITGWLKRS
ncbi:MAG: 2OG-Fe(II) oxygenase [Saprospiraceae bacterium]